MTGRKAVPFSRRRFLAAAVAAACGWAALPMTQASVALLSRAVPGPADRPLGAADLYAPHDLAG
jgi:hypothetical protein